MHVCGLKEVGRAVQKVLNLWPYTLAITEQKKCWELLAQKYDQFNPLSPNINIQILQTDPYTFPLRISLREFNKRSKHFLFGDHLLILIT